MLTGRATRVMALLIAAIFVIPASVRADATDDYVGRWMAMFHAPGLAIAIVKDGRVVKVEAYGLADRERRLPVSADTMFKIGSVSKQFIATAVMLLVRDGRLTLDDPISRFLSDAPSAWRAITVRQLLSHTAGLVRESPAFDSGRNIPDIDVIRGAYAVPLLSPPGEKYAYSNVGYYVLAEIITRTSGRPWPRYVHDRVFEPAGLRLIATTTAQVTGRARGYSGNDNADIAADWVALRPSGAFVASVNELVKWDAILRSDRLLTRAERQQMITGVMLKDGSTAPYGFGWHVERFNEQRYIWHGGGMPGFSSSFARFPDAGLTVIALVNGDDVDTGSLVANLALLHLPAAPAPAK